MQLFEHCSKDPSRRLMIVEERGTPLDFAFDNLPLHKVKDQVLSFGRGSICMHQKFGFCQERALREQHKIRDNYHFIICFCLLCEEWNMQTRRSA